MLSERIDDMILCSAAHTNGIATQDSFNPSLPPDGANVWRFGVDTLQNVYQFRTAGASTVSNAPESQTMRILIADDHGLVRDTIAMFLESHGMSETVTVDSLGAAIAAVGKGTPFDLVLLDYNMPGMDGLDGLAQMKAANGGRPVAILSGTAAPSVAKDAIAAGAAGFVPKTLGVRAMIAALRFMAAGEVFVPYEFLQQSEDKAVGNLTERETEVLHGLSEGKSNKEIARDLDLQEVTIKLHVKTLCRKLGAKNRTQAAMIARDQKLI